MNREKAKQAVEDGFLEAIKNLAENEAKNEVTESGDEAEGQFARGLRVAKDAFERATIEVEKIFPE